MVPEDQAHHLNWKLFLLKNIITTEPFVLCFFSLQQLFEDMTILG